MITRIQLIHQLYAGDTWLGEARVCAATPSYRYSARSVRALLASFARDGLPFRSVEQLSTGMRTSLGYLRLRALAPTVFLDLDGEPTSSTDVFPPGAVVGRGDVADVRVLDESGHVSRVHALIQAQGVQWVIRDNNSPHGTRLQGAAKRLDLPPQVPVPLASGDEVLLAKVAAFSVEVKTSAATGASTAKASIPPAIAYITDPNVLELANELLRPRREHPGSSLAPSARELSERLHIEERTVYFRLDKLKALDPIRRRIPAQRPSMSQIADAVALAFPYLTRPQ